MVKIARSSPPAEAPGPNPKVDFFFDQATAWREECRALRSLALGCRLSEELKWGQPCYTQGGRNIVLIHGFKDYCALLFFNGALMKDPQGLLIRQTANVQAGRQIRFTRLADIKAQASALKAYIQEAIAVEKAGLKVKKKETADFPVPAEFRLRLNGDPALKAAFAALSPGRQRAYLYFFAGAKRSETRAARVDLHSPRILKGLGLDD